MKIVVIGAGYAGTIAANRLARKVEDAEITVVNPRAEFVERVRLHEQIVTAGRATTPLSEMLRPTVTVRVSAVDRIDDGTARLLDGTTLAFDYAIVAVGSTVSAPAGTVPIGTLEGAERARIRLRDLPAGAVVSVVGGGATGIETATEVAAARPDLTVRLIAPDVAATLSSRAQRYVRAEFERLRIHLVEDVVQEVRTRDHPSAGGPGHTVLLRDGHELHSDLTLWAVIDAVPDLVSSSGLAVDDRGRAVVDDCLRSVTDPRVFIVGDCAAVPGARFACATASPQGAHAADTLARTIEGRRLKPHSMGYAGIALSLGRRHGLLQLSRRDDTPRRMVITGRLAAVSKEIINRYAKYGSRTANYAWLPGTRS